MNNRIQQQIPGKEEESKAASGFKVNGEWLAENSGRGSFEARR